MDIRIVTIFFLAVTALLVAPDALAASPISDIFSTGVKTVTVAVAIFVIAIASLFAFLFATLIGNLMGSTYLLDSGMSPTLELVWVIMRNFTNYFILLLVLVLAVMVVTNLGGEESDGIAMLKKNIPKIILAIVAVNFTFFWARAVLTTNDILASAVFSLPGAVWQGEIRPAPCATTGGTDCSPAAVQKAAQKILGDKGSSTDKKMGQFLDKFFRGADEAAKTAIHRDNFALSLLSQMLDLKKILTVNVQINSTWGSVISTIGVAITTLLTAFIFFFIFAALVVRMVMLWVLIAISPLAVLLVVAKDGLKIPGLDQIDFMGNFIKYAFYPTAVAFPLSVGMVMIFAGNSFTSLGDGHLDPFTALLSGDAFAFLWWAAAIGVIWIGTKKTMETFAPIADGFTSGIHDFVNTAGKGALGSIKYAPIFPMPSGQSISFAGLRQSTELAKNRLAGAARTKAEPLGAALAGLIREDAGLPPSAAALNAALAKSSDTIAGALHSMELHTGNKGKLTGEITGDVLTKLNKKLTEIGGKQLETGAKHADFLRSLAATSAPEATRAKILLEKAGHTTDTEDAGKDGATKAGATGGGSAVSGGTDASAESPTKTILDIHIENITTLAGELAAGTKNEATANTELTEILKKLNTAGADGKTALDAAKAAGRADELIDALTSLQAHVGDAEIARIKTAIESLED